jgi:glycosyltransferase involved in cell wall biosynthesis
LTKKILAISNHSRMVGGGEHSLLECLSHLPDDWDILAVLPAEGELRKRLKIKGIATCVVSLPPVRPWLAYNMVSSLRSFLDLCKTAQPQLIYANGSRAAIYGGVVGRIMGIPVIWHCRITNRDIYLDPILTRLCTYIIANSQATAKRFGPILLSKVRVVYNGVNIKWLTEPDVKRPDSLQGIEKVILVLARVSRWKRHDLALSAFEKVASQEDRVHLFCLGDKDPLDLKWWKFIQEKAASSPFSDRIHWIGHVDEVRPWLKAASLLLLASENEPFGRVLVEAMACGVPVVATRSGGVPEIVRDRQDGILVKPGHIDQMADAISKVLGDDDLRRRLSMAGIEQAKLFSLDAHVKQMVQVFDQTVRK